MKKIWVCLVCVLLLFCTACGEKNVLDLYDNVTVDTSLETLKELHGNGTLTNEQERSCVIENPEITVLMDMAERLNAESRVEIQRIMRESWMLQTSLFAPDSNITAEDYQDLVSRLKQKYPDLDVVVSEEATYFYLKKDTAKEFPFVSVYWYTDSNLFIIYSICPESYYGS